MRPEIPPAVGFRQRLSRWLLALFGWRIAFRTPPPRSILIFYPHTSNWDFVIGIFARAGVALPAEFVGKDSLFKGPLAPVMRWLGGMPVNRRERTGFIGQLTAQLASRKRFCLALAPEGTRSRTDHWKSGFYHLALSLKVPVGLGFIDYPRKIIGVTEYLELTGDQATDLRNLRAYYADKVGLHPEHASDIQFTEGGTRSRHG